MNRFLGKAANVGMLFLCLLIAANGALCYSYLERLLADVRRADQANADLASYGDLWRQASELTAASLAYAASGDAGVGSGAQAMQENLAERLHAIDERPTADGRAPKELLAVLHQQGQALLQSTTNLLATRDKQATPLSADQVAPVEAAMAALRDAVAVLRDEGRVSSERWLQESIASQYSAKGSLINATFGALALLAAVFGLVRRDVRERLVAEQRLRHEEARFRRLVDSDVMGVLIAKVDGQVTEANETFLKMIGYRREDLTAGRINWRSLTPSSCDPSDQVALQQLADKGVAQPYEKQFLHSAGNEVPVLLGSARVDPAREDMICYAIDLSQSKAAEALIQRLNRELQDRVHELETLFELTPVALGLSQRPRMSPYCRERRNGADLGNSLFGKRVADRPG